MDTSKAESCTVLVTGGTGWLGSQLVANLAERGHTVVAPSRKGPDPWDLLGENQTFTISSDVDAVVHCAGVLPGAGEDALAHGPNERMAQAVVAAVANSTVRLVIGVSSSAVYGPSHNAALETANLAPVTSYGRDKLASERALSACSDSAALRLLRFPLLVGPELPPVHSIRQFAGLAQRGLLPVVAQGKNRKSLLHIDDACDAIAAVIDRDLDSQPGLTTWNVASGSLSLAEIGRATTTKPVRLLSVPNAAVQALRKVATTIPFGPIQGVTRSLEKLASSDVVDGAAFTKAYGALPERDLIEIVRTAAKS